MLRRKSRVRNVNIPPTPVLPMNTFHTFGLRIRNCKVRGSDPVRNDCTRMELRKEDRGRIARQVGYPGIRSSGHPNSNGGSKRTRSSAIALDHLSLIAAIRRYDDLAPVFTNHKLYTRKANCSQRQESENPEDRHPQAPAKQPSRMPFRIAQFSVVIAVFHAPNL